MAIEKEELLNRLFACKHFVRLCELCSDNPFYVVGGAIRDAFLELPVTDIDLVFPVDPTPLAKDFASRSGGSWFWLDESRLQSRVVFDSPGSAPDFDFAPYRAPDLIGDLHDRDFTVNAVALDISRKALIDPLGGLDDLSSSILRMAGAEAFANDPLRILKGVRHATCLGLELAPSTLGSMQDNVDGLERVAVARVRQEFFKIISAVQADKGLWLLDECRAGSALFGDGFVNALQRMIASLPHYQTRWESLACISPLVEQWLDDEIEQGLSRRTLLLLTLLLQQIDQALPGSIADRWLLSRKAKTCITALSSLDSKTTSELVSVAHSPRALYWWTRQKGLDVQTILPFLVCHELPDETTTDAVHALMPIAVQVEDERLPDLVYGRWLSSHLGIDEGPEMSRALELLRNAEITGEVASEEEARTFLSQVYLDSD